MALLLNETYRTPPLRDMLLAPKVSDLALSDVVSSSSEKDRYTTTWQYPRVTCLDPPKGPVTLQSLGEAALLE